MSEHETVSRVNVKNGFHNRYLTKKAVCLAQSLTSSQRNSSLTVQETGGGLRAD
jgi:hypothetical protein